MTDGDLCCFASGIENDCPEKQTENWNRKQSVINDWEIGDTDIPGEQYGGSAEEIDCVARKIDSHIPAQWNWVIDEKDEHEQDEKNKRRNQRAPVENKVRREAYGSFLQPYKNQ